LCYAYDNFKEDVEHIELKSDLNVNKNFYQYYRPNRVLNFLRPFGIHKFLKIKYKYF
jgi:hypothetical protein